MSYLYSPLIIGFYVQFFGYTFWTNYLFQLWWNSLTFVVYHIWVLCFFCYFQYLCTICCPALLSHLPTCLLWSEVWRKADFHSLRFHILMLTTVQEEWLCRVWCLQLSTLFLSFLRAPWLACRFGLYMDLFWL